MNPNAHLSTILILGKDEKFRAFSHAVVESAEEGEQAAADILPILCAKNPATTFVHRTMPFQHVANTAKLNILL